MVYALSTFTLFFIVLFWVPEKETNIASQVGTFLQIMNWFHHKHNTRVPSILTRPSNQDTKRRQIKMSQFSFSCSSCSVFFLFFFFFFIITPQEKTFISGAFSIDIINQTCKTCAEKSTVFSYDLCLTSLQTIPVSHATNIQGLALIAIELALENATNTISSIEKLLTSATFDPFAKACLEDCFELYSKGVVTLINVIGAFLTGQYGTANVWLSAVMEATMTCEEGFTDREGEVSPLTKENYNLFQLCDIALCIIHLLSQSSYS